MTSAYIQDNPCAGLPLAFGLLLSAMVHFAIFIVFVRTPDFERQKPFVAEVTFELPKPGTLQPADAQNESPPPPPLIQRNQIVSSPDSPVDKGVDTQPRHLFESDRDARTAREQIKRGEDREAGIPGLKSNAPRDAGKNPERKTEESRKNSEKPLEHLKLDESTMLQKYAMNDQSVTKPSSANEAAFNPHTYEPFSRPPGTGAKLLGNPGINDYLPDLPDGDITLLNTKANKFATFVRRIASQVFSQMRAGGIEALSASEITRAANFSIVRARLSPGGELLSVSLENPSGSARFDDILLKSARAGSRDPNPPPDATASDGTIQFVFQSRIWGEMSTDRSGMPFRRVWLLLATGLD